MRRALAPTLILTVPLMAAAAASADPGDCAVYLVTVEGSYVGSYVGYDCASRSSQANRDCVQANLRVLGYDNAFGATEHNPLCTYLQPPPIATQR